MPAPNSVTRAFIGIPVDQTLSDFFQQFQQQQRRSPWFSQARWVAPPKLHLTLRFLGNIDESQLQHIKNGLYRLSATPFYVPCSSPKPFPNMRKPRMLASFVHKNPELEQLAQWAETLALDAGLPEEKRPFLGHITVARFRNAVNGLQALIQNTESCRFPVERVVLYQGSVPGPGKGPHAPYEALAEQVLRT